MNEKKITLEGKPPALIPANCDLWQAWWEDNDSWDGYNFYRAEDDFDLEVAQMHAAHDYMGAEYCWYPDDDDGDGEDERPDVELSWDFDHNRWHLLENGKATGVTLTRVRIWEALNHPVRGARSAPRTV